MIKIFKKILEHKIVSLVFLFGFILVIGGWLKAYIALREVSQPLILHFNNAVGINQIGNLGDLAAVGIFGLVALVLDFFVSIELDERDQFLGKMTAAAGLFLAILIFIGFSAIISVN
ncbi:MAG: hypothetical protein A3B13_01975 [Candidatus Liptonbacteria bacterium RIFCSPLOWO2_01_FULL_45_15]|uniref:DUF1648 domain-containing protein n=1 Tax=Candidatus Liptonbacteria bacterium RIFCSPLOWO2_01_FULL_45_15 TaxID=1798649 RepID=A0A1G2CEW1_9BACT|nr:MAG: hypothetical protein A3B13_01975 [Candidatus Liptonbacteria bacterium RIFCSPLOWO2_01_FULL_45_15]